MSSQNRVQAIKKKFEELKKEDHSSKPQKLAIISHLCKQERINKTHTNNSNSQVQSAEVHNVIKSESDSSSEEFLPAPNNSYLYAKTLVCTPNKQNVIYPTNDSSKKLQRSHAFRCDKSQKINGPSQHSSFNSRSDHDISQKHELAFNMNKPDSIADKNVPKHILDQYAKVLKPSKQDLMTDSGVSSETENQEDCSDKTNRLKQNKAQFETEIKTKFNRNEKICKTNLEVMTGNDLCSSSSLERKNPDIDLTETLKRALKQPLPPGPPPKKPPRVFQTSPITADLEQRSNTKHMLKKLEQVFLEREEKKSPPKIIESSNKEIHYLCTEILDITARTLLPNTQKNDTFGCLKSLNCSSVPAKSTLSLPYTRLSTGSINPNSLSNLCCACSAESLDKPIEQRHKFSTFFALQPDKNLCKVCNSNFNKTGKFQCHINCNCKESRFFVPKEHIYDEPNLDIDETVKRPIRLSLQPDLLQSIKESDVREEKYGSLKSSRINSHSRSMEELRFNKLQPMEEKIYDEPCELSRSPSPEFHSANPRRHFESLRLNFENGFKNPNSQKPPIKEKPRPLLKGFSDSKLRPAKSIENFEMAKKNLEKKFSTEVRRPRKNLNVSPPDKKPITKKKNEYQLDVDRENLNRLMNEIYETVSAACRMDEQLKPTRFPTDSSDGSSEDSVKLTRSLTEKRKNYVRRVSSRAGCLDKPIKNRFRHQTSVCSYNSQKPENHYATFRSWKDFRQENQMAARRDSTDSKFNLTDSKGNLLSLKDEFSDDLDNLDLDDKAGCLDLELPFEPRERGLFDICLLVGLNHMTGETYVKSVFPNQVKVPPHIGNLIFPERLSDDTKPEYDLDAKRTQNYSLVLTNEKGERNFGYCRRVLPEGANYCLPLCYCIIGRYRAPGFYYKVLQEIESQHGSSEFELNFLLRQLINHEFPSPGQEIHVNYTSSTNLQKCFRNSVNLGDILKSKTLQAKSESSEKLLNPNTIPEYYDIENNNNKKHLLADVGNSKGLKRSIEPRMDEFNVSVLVDSLGPGLVVKVFGSLLMERKVILISDNLSQLSSCMEALQSILYPLVWQQPLISTIPAELSKDILEAPLPILAGMLRRYNETMDYITDMEFREGMLIDLSNSSTKLVFYQGDESSILPSIFYKTLKTTLQMESSKSNQKDPEGGGTRNVMISEAFLRFFVDVLSDFWNYFSFGEVKEGDLGKNGVLFDRDSFQKDAPPKQTDFLQWFTETAMFNHFIQNMALCHPTRDKTTTIDYSTIEGIVDVPLPNFYELFDERVTRKLKNSKKTLNNKSEHPVKNNYKSAMNNKIKVLKSKLRDLVN